MYTPNNPCSSFIHLLLKFPVLIVALGLAGAVFFLQPFANNPDDPAIMAKVNSVKANTVKMSEKTPTVFDAIVKTESNLDKDILEESKKHFDAINALGGDIVGVHPDGKSHGSSGLTKIAAKEVSKKLPDCASLGYDEIFNNDVAITQFSYLYFLDLVHKYKSINTAVTAYHYGPTKVDTWKKEGKPLPTEYLKKVKSHIKK
jgi:hypothetical protein